jgi:hypothetical protein
MYLFTHGTFSSIKMFKQDIKKYFDRLQNKLGETYSADKILKGPWLEGVVRELNLMSHHYARELQLETRQPYRKDFSDAKGL